MRIFLTIFLVLTVIYVATIVIGSIVHRTTNSYNEKLKKLTKLREKNAKMRKNVTNYEYIKRQRERESENYNTTRYIIDQDSIDYSSGTNSLHDYEVEPEPEPEPTINRPESHILVKKENLKIVK